MLVRSEFRNRLGIIRLAFLLLEGLAWFAEEVLGLRLRLATLSTRSHASGSWGLAFAGIRWLRSLYRSSTACNRCFLYLNTFPFSSLCLLLCWTISPLDALAPWSTFHLQKTFDLHNWTFFILEVLGTSTTELISLLFIEIIEGAHFCSILGLVRSLFIASWPLGEDYLFFVLVDTIEDGERLLFLLCYKVLLDRITPVLGRYDGFGRRWAPVERSDSQCGSRSLWEGQRARRCVAFYLYGVPLIP